MYIYLSLYWSTKQFYTRSNWYILDSNKPELISLDYLTPIYDISLNKFSLKGSIPRSEHPERANITSDSVERSNTYLWMLVSIPVLGILISTIVIHERRRGRLCSREMPIDDDSNLWLEFDPPQTTADETKLHISQQTWNRGSLRASASFKLALQLYFLHTNRVFSDMPHWYISDISRWWLL